MDDLRLPERIGHLLKCSEYSDCTFKVGDQTFKAHRLILSISSPVFRAMLYGIFNTTEDIVITDIEPNVFQMMLGYIYTDNVDIESADEACDLLYASKKYMLSQLTKECLKFLEKHITMDSALTIFTHCRFLQEQELAESAFMFVLGRADIILDKFLDEVSEECMQSILESNNVNIMEKDLIFAVARWSQLYCRQHKLSTSIESQRQVLMQFEFHKMLRFQSLSCAELEELMVTTEILPSNEFLIFLNKIEQNKIAGDAEDDNKIVFAQCTETRRRVFNEAWFRTYYFTRIFVPRVSHLIINYVKHNLQIRFKSRSTVLLKALCVPTQMLPRELISNATTRYTEKIIVLVALEATGTFVCNMIHTKSVEYNSAQLIKFKKPCILDRDKWYLVTFIWPKDETTLRKYKLQSCVPDIRRRVEWEIDDMSNRLDGSFLEGIKYSY